MEMNIQKYMSFVKTVEYGSFTKASEILNYSQSGISRMIGDLEKEWNMCLLERDHSGVKPTSDGLRLLPFAKKLCDDFDRLQMEADNLNDLSSGIIRIGTFSSVATYWLPNIIMEFKKDYPNIEYELLIGDYDEIESWITDGRVDCGFICLPASPGIETIFLEEDAFLAILPNEHPLLKYEKVPLKELSKSLKSLRKIILHRIHNLRHGMTMPSCQWSNMGSESASCLSLYCKKNLLIS